MGRSYISQLEDLQRRLKPQCHIELGHEEYFGFYAMVRTDGNRYPHWIKFYGSTLRKAIRKLLGFFNGTVKDHRIVKRTPQDFLA